MCDEKIDELNELVDWGLAKAFKWMTKAAEQDDKDAKEWLAENVNTSGLGHSNTDYISKK